MTSSGFEKLFQMKADEAAAQAAEKTRREDKEESFNRLLQTARNIMNRYGIAASEAMDIVDAPEEDKKKMLEALLQD